jgi:hypothetical protein
MGTPSHSGRSRWPSQSPSGSSPIDSITSSSFPATFSLSRVYFMLWYLSAGGVSRACDMPVGSLMLEGFLNLGTPFIPSLVSPSQASRNPCSLGLQTSISSAGKHSGRVSLRRWLSYSSASCTSRSTCVWSDVTQTETDPLQSGSRARRFPAGRQCRSRQRIGRARNLKYGCRTARYSSQLPLLRQHGAL